MRWQERLRRRHEMVSFHSGKKRTRKSKSGSKPCLQRTALESLDCARFPRPVIAAKKLQYDGALVAGSSRPSATMTK